MNQTLKSHTLCQYKKNRTLNQDPLYLRSPKPTGTMAAECAPGFYRLVTSILGLGLVEDNRTTCEEEDNMVLKRFAKLIAYGIDIIDVDMRR